MMMMMDDDSFEISFAGQIAFFFFLFGWCWSLDWGFLVILGIFLIKWNIAKNCILFDKMALKLSDGMKYNELFCMY